MPREPWILNGVALERNASSLSIRPAFNEEEKWMLNVVRKQTSARAAGDPRTVRYRDIEASWFYARRPFIALVNNLFSFHRAGFYIKLFQEDYPRRSTPPNFSEAALLLPANHPIVGDCASFYTPHRGLSTDAGDGPFLYRNGTLVTSGITWDYAEGKVTFSTAIPSSDSVLAYYRWKPLVKVVSFDANPIEGRTHDEPRYNPTVTFKQL